MRVISILVLVVGWSSFPAPAHGQQFQRMVAPPNKVGVDMETGKVLVGPDPNKTLDLYGLLSGHPAVANELGQLDALEQLKEWQQKSFKDFAFGKKIEELRGKGREFLRKGRRVFENTMAETLTPDHMERLRQLAYRYEVSAIGQATALADGRLGADAGVHEQQRGQILRKGEDLEARTRACIEAIRKQAEEELLAELTPEQQRNAQELLGDFVFFRGLSNLKEKRQELLERSSSQTDR